MNTFQGKLKICDFPVVIEPIHAIHDGNYTFKLHSLDEICLKWWIFEIFFRVIQIREGSEQLSVF